MAAIATVLSRRQRLRKDIRENLALVEEIEKNDTLREHTPTALWIHGRITIDVARLTGQKLGTPKKPIPVGSLIFTIILCVGFGLWTYYIAHDGFEWYSVFPGVASALMIIAALGMFTNRELPPDQDPTLPPGATPVAALDEGEKLANRISLSKEGISERYAENGPVGVVYRFLAAAQEGRQEDWLLAVDQNWIHCRVQTWLWEISKDSDENLMHQDDLANSLATNGQPNDVWERFLTDERKHLQNLWRDVDLTKLGAGSAQRRIGPDYEMVILAPTGDTDGYVVQSATIVRGAHTFVVHKVKNSWKVANHVGTASPSPGWPPAWWTTSEEI
ncbi:hypothetical protein O7543_29475 [Solwaraspora sp. WMMA2080]|uniref:hypothetical protein n=1 Tax=unclassified Solwaraspora TaxID=2627926 RepID=UPI00248B9151|nr:MULTISPECIES: hypothetical protein [unclassified Solwaraspora]WBB95270.1 hypothetical protein O7553_17885 [Solwaraspora sp. WMMA2059]WBC20825.1 hypothetical protein O7543_29475 [Solwaraspora sp. WMMA2080]